MRPSTKRVIIDICVFIGALILPWWLSVILIIGCIVYFPVYIEALFIAFLFGTLYATRYEFPQTALLVTTAFLLVTMFVRTRIRN